MFHKLGVLTALACVPACLLADFSYEQETKVTGGMMAGMLKFAGAFSKQAREPMQSTVAVKGNRMYHGSKDRASIIDLDNETITEINFQKKTYSVLTFAEMKQAMEQAIERMKDAPRQSGQTPAAEGEKPDVKTDFKMDIKNTGQAREIAGVQAKQMILTMQIEGTDRQSGNKGAMVVTSDMWLAPKIAGYDEIREFHIKMAQKIGWSPDSSMGSMLMSRPDLARAMETARKEGSKMEGIPVLTVMTISGSAEGQPGDAPPPPEPKSKPADSPSLSGALAGRLGGFGGFGRKKKDDAAQSNSAAAEKTSASGSLIETTTQMSSFSAAPADPSRFSVPGGFKKVESEMQRRQRQ